MATIPIFPSYRVSQLNEINNPSLEALFTVAEYEPASSPTGYVSYKITSENFINLLSYWDNVDIGGVDYLVPKVGKGLSVDGPVIFNNGEFTFGANMFNSVITSAAPSSTDDRVMVTKGYVLEVTENARLYLGYFQYTDQLLWTDYPTNTIPRVGLEGQYATNGETDTIWTWDVEGAEWLDTHNTDDLLWKLDGLNLSPVAVGAHVRLLNNTGYYINNISGTQKPVVNIDTNNDIIIGTWNGVNGLNLQAGGSATEVRIDTTGTIFNYAGKLHDFVIRAPGAGLDALRYTGSAITPVFQYSANIRFDHLLGFESFDSTGTGVVNIFKLDPSNIIEIGDEGQPNPIDFISGHLTDVNFRNKFRVDPNRTTANIQSRNIDFRVMRWSNFGSPGDRVIDYDAGGDYLNLLCGDINITAEAILSLAAPSVDIAGTTTVVLSAPVNGAQLSAQPNGLVPLAIATTQYAQTAAAAATLWESNASVLSPKASGEVVTVESLHVLNAAASDATIETTLDSSYARLHFKAPGAEMGFTLNDDTHQFYLYDYTHSQQRMSFDAVTGAVNFNNAVNLSTLSHSPDGTVPLAIATVAWVTEQLPEPNISGTFDDASLDVDLPKPEDYLYIPHTYGLWYPTAFAIYDNNNFLLLGPDSMEVDVNIIKVNMGSLRPLTGIWSYWAGPALSAYGVSAGEGEILYNDGGEIAGDPDWTFVKATNTVNLNGTLAANEINLNGDLNFTAASASVTANTLDLAMQANSDDISISAPLTPNIVNVSGDGYVGVGCLGDISYKLQVAGTIAPDATGQDLGTAALRWDMYAGTINASGDIGVGGTLFPQVNGGQLGTSVLRWDAFLQDTTIYGQLSVVNTATIVPQYALVHTTGNNVLKTAVSSVASNSTIVQRHSSGYIYANYFNTDPNDVTSGVTKVCVETGDDGFIRHGTAAAIRAFTKTSNQVQQDFFIGGVYNDAVRSQLAWSLMNTTGRWELPNAKLVKVVAYHKTPDSSTEAQINININGANGLNANLTMSGSSGVAVVSTNVAAITVVTGQYVDIKCNVAGASGNARDLTVMTTWEFV